MERTWKPTTAGILNIISGAMGIGSGITTIVIGGFIGQLSGFSTQISNAINEWAGMWIPEATDLQSLISEVVGMSSAILLAVGITLLIFGIIALVGGIYALKREKWGLGLAGSILAIPSGGVLGILAIIFIALGKKEF
jgi:hypothetical protein